MKRRLPILLAAIMMATSTVVGAPSAHANHDNDLGHWNQPPLVISQAPTWWDSHIQDAAYYWQNVAFFRGYYPPLPSHTDVYPGNCVPVVGRINFCIVAPGDPHLFINGQEKLARTDTYLYPDGSGHIQAVMIWFKYTLTGAELQNTMRHEFGHALGLGHTNKPGSGHSVPSVMNDPAVTPYADYVDTASIYVWQPPYHDQH